MSAQVQFGLGKASIYIRHARTLKDKRAVVQSLVKKLRNLHFSVVEQRDESPKQATLGFCYAGQDHAQITSVLDAANRVFVGDFDVVSIYTEVTDFSYDDEQDQYEVLDQDEFAK